MPDAPDKDPVVSQSLAQIYFVSAILLIVTFGWSLYDEFFHLRPWKRYQREFVRHYRTFLQKEIPKQKSAEKAIVESPEFLALKRQMAKRR